MSRTHAPDSQAGPAWGRLRSVGLSLALAAMLLACAPTPSRTAGAPASPTDVPVGATARPTAVPTAAAAKSASPVGSSLVVEEYPVVAKEVDTPDHFEYSQRIAAEVRAKRAGWREQSDAARRAIVDEPLAKLGYRLVETKREKGSPTFDLYQGETLVKGNLGMVFPVAVNARGDDFALVAELLGSGTVLIRRDSVEPWDQMRAGYTWPVFVGNDLVQVEIDYGAASLATGKVRVTVSRNGKTAATIYAEDQPTDIPVKGLWSWDGHWVLETKGEVFVDGESLNRRIGADEVFNWRLVDGQPLYFFSKGGKVQVSYAGQMLPQAYDEVIHYRCCEPAIFNVGANDRMVWFHALKDGTWRYVEMGVYRDAEAVATATPVATPTAAQSAAGEASSRPAKTAFNAADVGPGWEQAKPTAADGERTVGSFVWKGDGTSALSPEGLSRVVFEAATYPDAASALAALEPLLADQSEVSGPSVGDRSRVYTAPADQGQRVVYVEAAVGTTWLRVAVTGSPQSEVKASRAAELAKLLISRLPE